MRSILYVSCSPRGPASHSGRFGAVVLERLGRLYPDAALIRRDLIADPVGLVDAAFSAAILDPSSGSDRFPRSEVLIQELEAADAVVLATPMHNYTVPAALKAWIDQIVRIHRSFASTPAGKVGLLPDRPVIVVIASGGWFTGPTPTGAPAQPDFLTPYLRAVFNTIGITDLHFITLEGVTRGPEMLDRALGAAMTALDGILGSLPGQQGF